VNDACDDAFEIGALPFEVAGSSINATLPESFDTLTCNYDPSTDIGVWYSLAGDDRIISAKITDASFQTRLAVFTGSCEAPVCVKQSSNLNSMHWEGSSGVNYWLVVKGASSTTGTFNLQLTAVS
jgi:hypothetical protein